MRSGTMSAWWRRRRRYRPYYSVRGALSRVSSANTQFKKCSLTGWFSKALPQNATLLLCSTVPASYAQSVAAELQSRGRGDIQFIDAPVSGGAKRAADGTLSIMAGAPDAALESGRFLLEAMSDSNKLYLVPGGIGAGSNMKMVHQVLAGIHILGASEAMGFAAQLGLDATKTADAIKSSGSWTWMHENRLQRMLEEDWNPGASALTIILKDVVSQFGSFCVLPWI